MKIRAAFCITCCIISQPNVAAASDKWTFIDPGNDARVEDYVGRPGGTVCVQAVEAHSLRPARVRLWRDADPGGKKDLDYMVGSRTLKTKGLRYSVFVHNTNPFPVYAASCKGSVKTLKIIDLKY